MRIKDLVIKTSVCLVAMILYVWIWKVFIDLILFMYWGLTEMVNKLLLKIFILI